MMLCLLLTAALGDGALRGLLRLIAQSTSSAIQLMTRGRIPSSLPQESTPPPSQLARSMDHAVLLTWLCVLTLSFCLQEAGDLATMLPDLLKTGTWFRERQTAALVAAAFEGTHINANLIALLPIAAAPNTTPDRQMMPYILCVVRDVVITDDGQHKARVALPGRGEQEVALELFQDVSWEEMQQPWREVRRHDPGGRGDLYSTGS